MNWSGRFFSQFAMLEISKTIHHCDEICSRVCFKMKDLRVFPLEMLHFKKKGRKNPYACKFIIGTLEALWKKPGQLIGRLICRLFRLFTEVSPRDFIGGASRRSDSDHLRLMILTIDHLWNVHSWGVTMGHDRSWSPKTTSCSCLEWLLARVFHLEGRGVQCQAFWRCLSVFVC